MLTVEDHQDLSLSTLITKVPPDKSVPRYDGASHTPVIARDAFVAENALKIEQLQAMLRLVTRDVGQLAGKVSDLQESTAQENRAYIYHQNEKRSRDCKLEEMVRSFRDLKARLDRMEARSGGDYHAYNSFEAVSRKLAEIEKSLETPPHGARGDTFRACLLAAAIVIAAAIIGASLVLSGGPIV